MTLNLLAPLIIMLWIAIHAVAALAIMGVDEKWHPIEWLATFTFVFGGAITWFILKIVYNAFFVGHDDRKTQKIIAKNVQKVKENLYKT